MNKTQRERVLSQELPKHFRLQKVRGTVYVQKKDKHGNYRTLRKENYDTVLPAGLPQRSMRVWRVKQYLEGTYPPASKTSVADWFYLDNDGQLRARWTNQVLEGKRIIDLPSELERHLRGKAVMSYTTIKRCLQDGVEPAPRISFEARRKLKLKRQSESRYDVVITDDMSDIEKLKQIFYFDNDVLMRKVDNQGALDVRVVGYNVVMPDFYTHQKSMKRPKLEKILLGTYQPPSSLLSDYFSLDSDGTVTRLSDNHTYKEMDSVAMPRTIATIIDPHSTWKTDILLPLSTVKHHLYTNTNPTLRSPEITYHYIPRGTRVFDDYYLSSINNSPIVYHAKFGLMNNPDKHELIRWNGTSFVAVVNDKITTKGMIGLPADHPESISYERLAYYSVTGILAEPRTVRITKDGLERVSVGHSQSWMRKPYDGMNDYKGVRDNGFGSYVAYFRREYIGTFPTAREAYDAHLKAVEEWTGGVTEGDHLKEKREGKQRDLSHYMKTSRYKPFSGKRQRAFEKRKERKL